MAFFGDSKSVATLAETEIKGLTIEQRKYVEISSIALYERIAYTVIKEIQTTEEKAEMLTLSASDNYSPFSRGFVHFLAEAMAKRTQVFIKKEQAGKEYIFTRSSSSEADQPDVIELDFRKFKQSQLLNEYYDMLYLALNGAMKGVRISQGLLVKVARLSEMMADTRQIESVETQIKHISDALREAKTAYMDSNSDAGFAEFDTEPTEKAIDFVYQLISNLTGFSMTWVKGEKGGSSMSDSGESDRKQNRTAIEFYFISVIQPVLEAIFKETFRLKPNLDNIESIPAMLATIEMWGEGSEEGKKFLYSQIGLSEEHLDLSGSRNNLKTDEQ